MALLSSSLFSSTFLAGEAPSFAAFPHSSTSVAVAPAAAQVRVSRAVTVATASKEATEKTPVLRGIMKPRRVSPEMQELVGVPEISRTQALKVIWAHIKENNLQDPENKKIVVCDDKLKKIFQERDRVGFLEVAGLITPHFL